MRAIENRTPGGGIARRRRFPPAALLLLTAMIFFGCDRGGNTEADSPEEEPGTASTTVITAFGSVVAAERQEIHLPWAGRIVDIPVWEGQRVSRGDTLAVLDPADLQAALDEARFESDIARGLYEEASSRLAALDVSLEESRDRLERNLRVVDNGSVSTQELNALQAEYDALVHDRSASAWALKACEGEKNQADRAYNYLLNRSEGDFIRDNLLICPYDSAVVAEISVSPGSEVGSGKLVLVLHDENSLIVEADLPEEFVRDVPAGSSATIVPIADSERSYAGTVVELAGLARLVNGENVVKTRVRLDEHDGFLREGFNVDVEIRR